MTREGQAVALDGVSDETGRPVVLDGVEGLQQAFHVVPSEVGHQLGQRRVVEAGEKPLDRGLAADIGHELAPPGRSSLIDQGRIERIGAFVDPAPQGGASGTAEHRLQRLSVLQGHNPPAHVLEELVDAVEEPVGDH